jgi:hypothetical protein
VCFMPPRSRIAEQLTDFFRLSSVLSVSCASVIDHACVTAGANSAAPVLVNEKRPPSEFKHEL